MPSVRVLSAVSYRLQSQSASHAGAAEAVQPCRPLRATDDTPFPDACREVKTRFRRICDVVCEAAKRVDVSAEVVSSSAP